MSENNIESIKDLGVTIIEPKDKKGKKYLCVKNFQGYCVLPDDLIQYIADNQFNIVNVNFFPNKNGFYLLAEKQILPLHSKKLILEKYE